MGAASRGMARRVAKPRRRDVWLVNFDPTLGAEIKKVRPALIIQNDVGNQVSPITIVAAITSNVKKVTPVQVFVPAGEAGLNVNSMIVLNQIRSVDHVRLRRKLGILSEARMAEVESAILISIGIEQPI
jgi:mRNA interferase MazF